MRIDILKDAGGNGYVNDWQFVLRHKTLIAMQQVYQFQQQNHNS